MAARFVRALNAFGGLASGRWQGATVKAIAANLAVVHGPIEKGHSVFGSGFVKHIADMVINRALADHQRRGDFLVGETLGNPFNDLQFPLR